MRRHSTTDSFNEHLSIRHRPRGQIKTRYEASFAARKLFLRKNRKKRSHEIDDVFWVMCLVVATSYHCRLIARQQSQSQWDAETSNKLQSRIELIIHRYTTETHSRNSFINIVISKFISMRRHSYLLRDERFIFYKLLHSVFSRNGNGQICKLKINNKRPSPKNFQRSFAFINLYASC